jgi:hypothetical protein
MPETGLMDDEGVAEGLRRADLIPAEGGAWSGLLFGATTGRAEA